MRSASASRSLIVTALAALALCPPGAGAQATLTPLEDRYISEHPVLGGPDATHGASDILFAITTPTFESYPLVKPDLTPFAGHAVVGPTATLSLFVGGSFTQATPRDTAVAAVLTPWDADTATFNNFGPTPGMQVSADVGPILDTEPVLFPGPGPRYVSWMVPASVLQSWIDSPGSNNGLAVGNLTSHSHFDLIFDSAEGRNKPRLAFRSVLVPEPGIGATLMGMGVAGLSLRRRKRRAEPPEPATSAPFRGIGRARSVTVATIW
ncbi:MAG: PEP-CTERM sorting domain-containing protein [Chthonomonadales bacterium]|nr:PEP-CTERM sorting domain-containing protein [Chthonomonadales bacterium]